MKVKTGRIALFCFLWAAALAAQSSSSLAQPPLKSEQVKVAFSNYGMPIFTLMLARELGFFRDEQLTVEMVMMSSALAGMALVAGDLDYSTMAGQLITQAAAKAPVKVIFVNLNRPMFMFVGRPEIKAIKDLKGKAIGVGSHGAIDDLLARRVISSGELNPEKDVTVLALGSTSHRLAALKAGTIAATNLTVPYNLIVERMGYTRLGFAGDLMQPVVNGLGTSDKKLKDQPGQIKRMIRAMLKAQNHLRNHREESIQKAMAWYKFDRQAAELAYDLLVQGMPEGGLPADENFKVIIEQGRSRQVIKEEVPLSRVADLSILKEALREIIP
ncbi:MAG: ABC transporter substrate-binding protein [Deltaproteobacteria bacterium]|nr:ABC transporter substrate-binding protein [Deltaproteobacteria bacterium]